MQNLHMLHLEELVYSRDTITKLLSANKLKRKNLSTKYDGSPAVIFGWKDGDFFVGTKSVFNKTPKICNSLSDICKYHENREVVNILLWLLDNMIYYCPMGKIYQADVLGFGQSIQPIDSDSFSTKMNVLQYVIEWPFQIPKMVLSVHSEYDSNLNLISFAPDTSFLEKAWKVFFNINTGIPRSIKFNNYIIPPFLCRMITESYNSIQYGSIEPLTLQLLKEFHNSFYRTNSYKKLFDIDHINFIDKFSEFILSKTPKRISVASAKYIISNAAEYQLDLEKLLRLSVEIGEYKNIFLDTLDSELQPNIFIDDTFFGKNEGYVITGGELSGIKLVNRKLFSTLNFRRDNDKSR